MADEERVLPPLNEVILTRTERELADSLGEYVSEALREGSDSARHAQDNAKPSLPPHGR